MSANNSTTVEVGDACKGLTAFAVIKAFNALVEYPFRLAAGSSVSIVCKRERVVVSHSLVDACCCQVRLYQWPYLKRNLQIPHGLDLCSGNSRPRTPCIRSNKIQFLRAAMIEAVAVESSLIGRIG